MSLLQYQRYMRLDALNREAQGLITRLARIADEERELRAGCSHVADEEGACMACGAHV